MTSRSAEWQNVTLKIIINWKTHPGADAKPTDVTAGISLLLVVQLPIWLPGALSQSLQSNRIKANWKEEKKSPVIGPSSSLSTVLVSLQVYKQPAPTTRRKLVCTGELRLHLLKIWTERVITSDSEKGIRLKKGCSKLDKAKWFICCCCFWNKLYGTLFLSHCPRNLAAWSWWGKTRDTMQVFTVAGLIKESSLPAGSFGTGASSCMDRRKQ